MKTTIVTARLDSPFDPYYEERPNVDFALAGTKIEYIKASHYSQFPDGITDETMPGHIGYACTNALNDLFQIPWTILRKAPKKAQFDVSFTTSPKYFLGAVQFAYGYIITREHSLLDIAIFVPVDAKGKTPANPAYSRHRVGEAYTKVFGKKRVWVTIDEFNGWTRIPPSSRGAPLRWRRTVGKQAGRVIIVRNPRPY